MATTFTASRTPVHLWIVGVVSLLWNAIGAFDYLMTHFQVEWYMGNFTPEQLDYFYGFPAWVVGAWAVGVWFAVGGSVALLLRRRWATWLFAMSIVGLALTTIHNYMLTDGYEIMGAGIGQIVFSVALWCIALGLLIYSVAMTRRGVLR